MIWSTKTPRRFLNQNRIVEIDWEFTRRNILKVKAYYNSTEKYFVKKEIAIQESFAFDEKQKNNLFKVM